MGASGWTYIVDYEPSVEEAFSKARWEIFRSGEYYKRPSLPLLSYEDWLGNYPPDMVTDIGLDEMQAMYAHEEMLSKMDPQTPDEALIFAQEDGTHSLIDFKDMRYGTLYSQEKNLEIFGTKTPTLEQVKSSELDAVLSRHSFCVVVAYQGDEKLKYVFFGVSGD